MTVRAEETSQDGAGERPLRRDAERNRRRILAAAAEVFTERGLDATLDEVARAANVGVGTVYRRFPDKESLVAELFRDRIDALVTVAEQACAAADPWEGLASYLEFAAAALAGDLGLRQLMMFATYDRDQVCYARERMFRLKFQLAMGQTDGVKKYRELRKERARTLTVVRERELHPELAPAVSAKRKKGK